MYFRVQAIMITCACILWTKKKDVTKNLLLEKDTR